MATWFWRYMAMKLSFVALAILSKTLADVEVAQQLPFCNPSPEFHSKDDLVIVSTLDGHISAFSLLGGEKAWELQTETLLSSNIHHIELTSNGQWARLVPSLSGSLYRLTADYLEPLPLNADHLLSSSFKYSDEIVIGGSRETRWLGVEARSGRILYRCGSAGCLSTRQPEAANTVLGELLVLRHNVNTVRALDPRNGVEKWNFSVSEHQLSLSDASQCHSLNDPGAGFKVSLGIPDGTVQVRGPSDELLWEQQLNAPVANAWRLGGGALHAIDAASAHGPSPSLYIGLHNQQLYIQESLDYPTFDPASPSMYMEPIEWKPVSADIVDPVAGTAISEIEQKRVATTALATLYNGGKYPLAPSGKNHGYFLKASNKVCDKNADILMIEQVDKHAQTKNEGEALHVHVHVSSLWYWWKEVLLIAISSALLMNLMIWPRFFAPRWRPSSPPPLNKEVLVIENYQEPLPEIITPQFTSRYNTDFKTERFIGRGGFGVVFEAKKNIDQRSYAVKRIILPHSQKKRDRVLREVLALAHLEHENIVRYYGSWVETPPPGWQQQQDTSWNRDVTLTMTGCEDFSTNLNRSSVTSKINKSNAPSDKTNKSVMLNMLHPEMSVDIPKRNRSSSFNDSCITFDRGDCSNEARDDFQMVFEKSSNDKRLSRVKNCENFNHNSSISNGGSKVKRKGHRRHWSLDMCARQPESTPTPPDGNDTNNAFLYIQMQLCRRDLRDWLRDNTDLPSRKEEVTKLFSQIVSAVEYVHNQGLIHRDLKPSNILFAPDGRVKVGDFGLVTAMTGEAAGPTATTNGADGAVNGRHTNLVGTHLYMSPEQLKGQTYSYKVDIYSLGIILFELLQPFHTDMERALTLQQLRNDQFPCDFISKFPEETKTLKRMLSVEPRERYTAAGVRHHAPLYQQTEPQYHYMLPESTCTTFKVALNGNRSIST